MLKFETLAVTPYQQNCSILYCSESFEAAIVDPGGDIDLILNKIKTIEQKLPNHQKLNVKQILLTHGHLDHCGQAPRLAAALNVPMIGPHIDEIFWLDLLPTISEMYQSKGFEKVPSFRPERFLNEGECIHIGQEILNVYHTPGHTPGHIVFHHAPSQYMWVGDVIFQGSIGRTDFPRGNFEQLIQSIFRLYDLGDTYFVSGHGSISCFSDELLHNPFLMPHADVLRAKLERQT
jgi:hydroxyacylglutathione hydrolase